MGKTFYFLLMIMLVFTTGCSNVEKDKNDAVSTETVMTSENGNEIVETAENAIEKDSSVKQENEQINPYVADIQRKDEFCQTYLADGYGEYYESDDPVIPLGSYMDYIFRKDNDVVIVLFDNQDTIFIKKNSEDVTFLDQNWKNTETPTYGANEFPEGYYQVSKEDASKGFSIKILDDTSFSIGEIQYNIVIG